MTTPELLLTIALGLAVVAYLAAWGAALLQVARTPHLGRADRILWLVTLLGFPLLGTLAWYALGRPRARPRIRRSGLPR